MKVVTVIPLSNNLKEESLTYFSNREIPAGTIVTVPLRKKSINALVIETEDLLKAKTLVKTSAFRLKKIEAIKGPPMFTDEFLKACLETKKYFAGHLGSVIKNLLPVIFLKKYHKLESQPKAERGVKKNNLAPEKLVIQVKLEDRLDFYKSYIRESFARKQSVFLCLPTINEVEFFASFLEKGIEKYSFSLHGSLTAGKQIEGYNQIIREKHPVLIVATGHFLCVPRPDFGTIIVERESSGAYRLLKQPYLDLRIFAELLAHQLKTKLILGDDLLRSETIWRLRERQLAEALPLSFRVLPEADLELVNNKKDGFQVISKPIWKVIKEAKEAKKNVFIFVLRKGLATITVCRDCGDIISCSSCRSPLVLRQSPSRGRFFGCNHCGRVEEAKIRCAKCQSWNLAPLGVGTDTVVEELKEKFPGGFIFQIDKEKVKSRSQGSKIISEFHRKAGGILVGTEMALFFLKEKAEYTIVASFDSLFSLPSFHIGEKITHLLNILGSYTKRALFIQTRNPENKILKAVQGGQIARFFEEELLERKKYGYPPYTTLIKLTHLGKKGDLAWIEKEVAEKFGSYRPAIYQAFTPKIKNIYRTNVLLRLKRQNWSLPALEPDGKIEEDLLEKLYALSPPHSWIIQINPEDLL